MKAQRLRVLVVAPYLPFPADSGFSIRVFNLVRHLATHLDVALLAYARPEESWKVEALEAHGVRTYTVMPPSRARAPDITGPASRAEALRLRAAMLARYPLPSSYQGSYLMTPALQAALAGLTSGGTFDVVQLETSELCGLVDTARSSGAYVVVDEHNIEYDLRFRMARAQRSPFKAINNWLEASKFGREERRCWSRIDGCLLVSERDRAIVARTVPQLATAVIANGADLEQFEPQPAPADSQPKLTFAGRMDYRPNADGIVRFVADVLPLIRRAYPVRLSIIGANPPRRVRALAGEAVEVIGWVPDVRPYLAAAVVPIPLWVGGGTRIKILEALAMARPIVSTTLGAEGLDVRDGEHLLLADEPEPMAAAIVRLLGDPTFAGEIGRRGRALVERKYDWAAIGSQLASFYEELLASRLARTGSAAQRRLVGVDEHGVR